MPEPETLRIGDLRLTHSGGCISFTDRMGKLVKVFGAQELFDMLGTAYRNEQAHLDERRNKVYVNSAEVCGAAS